MLSNHTERVAVIDEDPAIPDSLKLLLELEGYRVRTYLSAAAFLGDRAAHPTCLILDQHMPETTGIEKVIEKPVREEDLLQFVSVHG